MSAISLLVIILAGQATHPAAQPSASSQAAQGYVVGAQDVLNITVFGEADLSHRYAVDADGTFDFPFIGRVKVLGLTLRQLEELLAKKLAAGYLVNPQVSAEVAEYRSRSVFITGEVRSPGAYAIKGNMSLIEALALAGPDATASGTVIVVHPDAPRGDAGPLMPGAAGAESIRVNVKDLQSGKTSENVQLQDGDTIFVPKAETFFVTGHVRSPGAYVYAPGMTVLQAIALAGGLSERGSNKGIKILRIVNGAEKEISAKTADLVQPGDTLVIRQRLF